MSCTMSDMRCSSPRVVPPSTSRSSSRPRFAQGHLGATDQRCQRREEFMRDIRIEPLPTARTYGASAAAIVDMVNEPGEFFRLVRPSRRLSNVSVASV